MKLITKEVSNPEKKFWIWDEKITNKQDGRIYPHNTTNVGSGKSVAVYQLSESGKEEQIAQLEIPDYKKLEEYYWQEKEICLDYTYIDEFEWLGDKVPYEVEGNPYREYEKITARAAIFYSEEPKLIHLMQLKIQSEDLDFSYAGFYNLNLRFLYKGIIIKHNKTEPTYTKTSLFLCEKRRFFMARTEKGVVTTI